jgi:tRNA-specific 2-thiouridylase
MNGRKVFVGLSGGVDSAVSAALLVQAGYDVTGVFIKIWQPEFVACTWKEDRLDAMRVAVALGIPFATLDLSKEYAEEVITRMIADYARGITPNPDVLCNRFIKFGAFRKWAAERGADLIATGHHAQRAGSEGSYRLMRGADPGKDQAYFLCELEADDLSHALFPIGHMKKSDVRAEALRMKLPVATRPDSQGLCFVGDVDMHDFLAQLLKPIPGNVLDTAGSVIGKHDGAALYTLGQRHRFKVEDPRIAEASQYVIRIDTSANTITVAPDTALASRTHVAVLDMNWISGMPALPGPYEAEVRYHQKPRPCTLAYEGDQMLISFDEPQVATPGQSLVIYRGAECIGGGVIAAN